MPQEEDLAALLVEAAHLAFGLFYIAQILRSTRWAALADCSENWPGDCGLEAVISRENKGLEEYGAMDRDTKHDATSGGELLVLDRWWHMKKLVPV